MSNRYHISPDTNRPNICRAKTPDACPLKSEAGGTVAHFDNKAEAKAYAEKTLTEEHGETSTMKKSSTKIVSLTLPKSETNIETLASSNFDHNIASTYGEVSEETLNSLKRTYVRDVMANENAQKQLREMEAMINKQDEEAEANKIYTTADGVNRKIVETTAGTVRAGDYIHGEKFTNSGKWVHDDIKVVKVDYEYDFDMKEQILLTYENGSEGKLSSKSNVRVKRDVNDGEDLSRQFVDRKLKNTLADVKQHGLLKHSAAEDLLNTVNNRNVKLTSIRKMQTLSEELVDINQHDPSIKIDAAIARVKMRHDAEYEPNSGEAFSLLYDRERTDSKLSEELEKKYPSAAKSAAESRKIRADITARKKHEAHQRGETDFYA